jgi:hypothetical protein
MHPSTRRALEILDRLADFAPEQRDPNAVDPLQAWDELRQRSTPTTTRQHDRGEMIFKRFETPPTQPTQPAQSQPASATMDPVSQAAWDRWCESIVKNYAGAALEVAIEEVNKQDLALRALIDEMRTSIDGLRVGLDEMRGEIAQLRADIDNIEVQADATDA